MLKEIIIEGETAIGGNAFANCSNIENLHLNYVTEIGSGVFQNCNKLATITIGGSVTSIGDYSFANCDKLTDVYYMGTRKDWKKIPIGTSNDALVNAKIHYDETIVSNGTCGDNLTWALTDEGLLIISGTGPMKDYQAGWNSATGSQYAPWYDYPTNECTAVKEILIESGITHIGNTAFYKCTNVEEIIIPDTVTSIGQFAFWECNALNSIVIPDGVTTLNSGTFMGCDSLKKIIIGKNISDINYYAFGYINGIEEFVVDDENEYYSSIDGVLFNKDGTKLIKYTTGSENPEYTVPDGTLEIGTCAFLEAFNLESIVFPEGITEITSSIFYSMDNMNLKSITLPLSIQSVMIDISDLSDFTITYSGNRADWESVEKSSSIEENSVVEFLKDPIITGVELDKEMVELRVGQSIKLNAFITPETAEFKELIWKSSNESIATVDQDGYVIARSYGEAFISVQTVDGGHIAYCDVIVKREPTQGGGGSSSGGGGGSSSGGGSATPGETDTPSEPIEMTRASICEKIVDAFGFELDDTNTESPFTDLDESNECYEAILICNQLDIVRGYDDGTFRPESSITNAEVSKLIYATLSYIGWPVDVPEDADYDKTMWYGQYAWLAEELGIMVDVESWFDVTYDSNISFVLYRIGDIYQNNIEEILNPDLAPKKYIFEVGSTIVLRDNEEIESNYAPILYEGNVYCNARALAEAINAIAEYDDETKTITFYGWSNIIEYVIGEENCVTINAATYVNAEHFLNKMIGTRYTITANETHLTATKKDATDVTPEPTPDEETYIKVGSVTTRRGREIVLPITISYNVGLTGLQFNCNFDEVLTLKSVEVGNALSNLEFTTPGDLSSNNVTFLWDGMDADDSNGQILYLTFEVPENAEIGTCSIDLTVNTACDQNLNDVNVVTKSGKVNIIEFIPGDVNEDDERNAGDIILTRRYIAGGYGVSLIEAAADVDENNEINVKDVILLRRFIAGGYGVELN